MDESTSDWRANFVQYHELMKFLAAYLYRRDPRIARALVMDEAEELIHVLPEYTTFIDRNQWPLELINQYFAWLDSTFFREALPYWFCHKDPLESTYYCHSYGGDDPGIRHYYGNPSAEPILNVSWFFWFGAVPIVTLLFLIIGTYGIPNQGTMLELKQAFTMLLSEFFFNSDAYVSHYHSTDGGYTPNAPYFKEDLDPTDLDKGPRLSYGWALEEEMVRHYWLQTHRDWSSRCVTWFRALWCDYSPS